MPGVPGAPVQRIDGRETHGNFRRVGAAYDNGAGLAKVTNQGCVGRCDGIGQNGQPVGRRLALLVDVHLDGDRDPEEWSWVGKRLQLAVRNCGLGQCLAGKVNDNCVQPRIEPPNTLYDRGHDLGAGKLPAADTRNHVDRA